MHHIRNFCILAHIDHGKSTLADRFLELTNTVPKEKMRAQYLDMMDLERERGITIKMQPVRMIWRIPNHQIPNSKSQIPNEFQITNSQSQTAGSGFRDSNCEFSDSEFILNLIDTPGHVDFSYEVSRALAAVEGAILLVDATKGIQAQTIANLELAQKEGLVIIPAVNKIDAPNACSQETAEDLARLLHVDPAEVFLISAKYGTHVDRLLDAVVQKIPPPKITNEVFRALVFDSKYDTFRGVVAYVRVVDGMLARDEKIYLLAGQCEGEAKEVGYFAPEMQPQERLHAGEIGYIATGIKEPGKVRVGDTIISATYKAQDGKLYALPGYKEPKPMVFASFYPENPDEYDALQDALSKLRLQDPSFTFGPERREAFGRGFRCGFLGSLHLEIVAERLRREFQLSLVISSPSVGYKIFLKNGSELHIYSASDWPEYGTIESVQEPWVKLEILTPSSFTGKVTELLKEYSGIYTETRFMGEKIVLKYEMPLRELLRDFYGAFKGVTQGYGSLNYEFIEWRKGDVGKLEILIAGQKEEAFSQIIARKDASKIGRAVVEKLKELLPRQQFAVALQASFEGRIIARETIRAARKDVTAPLYGGDVTRKRKLLEKQKRGKKELKERGRVRVPAEVFLKMVRTL
jgi:GTP-binding protein LepA